MIEKKKAKVPKAAAMWNNGIDGEQWRMNDEGKIEYRRDPIKPLICPFKSPKSDNRMCSQLCYFSLDGNCSLKIDTAAGTVTVEKNRFCPINKTHLCTSACALRIGDACGMAEFIKAIQNNMKSGGKNNE